MSHQLETIIGYKFKNPKLLETALTHTSYANESRTPVQHNERLEFLGDSVLQIVSADYLFHAYADRPEGDLTRIRSSLVSEGALFQFAQEINLASICAWAGARSAAAAAPAPAWCPMPLRPSSPPCIWTAAWRWQRASSCPSSPRQAR